MSRTAQNIRRKRRKAPFRKLLGFFLVVSILIFGVSVFFRINDFRIEGDIRYTPQQIMEASGLQFGNHLLLIDEQAAVARIQSQLPYVGQVQITRQFPSRIVIWVEEATPVARTVSTYGVIILDNMGRILEVMETMPDIHLISVIGLYPVETPVAGQALNLGEEGEYQAEYLREILKAFYDRNLFSQIQSLDMADVLNPIFDLANRFTVHLGPNRNFTHKMYMLVEIYANIDPRDSGLIDLNPDNPIFRLE